MTRDRQGEKFYATYRLRRAIKTDEWIDETAERMLGMGYSEDIVGPLIDGWRASQRTPQEIAGIVGVSLATVYRYFNQIDQMEEEEEREQFYPQ